MKRLVALLLALGILALVTPMRADKEDKDKDKDKDKSEKKDVKKDKDKEDKPKDKDEKPKVVEEKLTKEQKKALEKLSGTFTVTLFERDGKKSPADELKKMKVIQKGAEWSFHLGDDITTGKDSVDPSKQPKEIDSLYTNGPATGQKVLGIYEVTGDTIKYCWAEPKKERPKDFATKADSGLTLMVLKRAKEEASEDKEKDKDKPKPKPKPKDKDKEKDKDKPKDKDKDKDKPKDKDKDKPKDKDKEKDKDKPKDKDKDKDKD